jgi:putative component of membrane protein insertase Oxa1/YidC/SpoIIIJ protein YidD
MRYLLLIPIKFYQLFISPLLGPNCRFDPSFTDYVAISISSSCNLPLVPQDENCQKNSNA